MRGKRLAVYVLALLTVVGMAGSALALGSAAPSHDYTEAAAADGAAAGYVIVTFKDPPAASYAGTIPGLQATRPGRGQKLDPNGPAVQAYQRYLEKVHADFRGYLARRAPRAEVVREFVYTLNGVAIKLNGHRPDTVAAGPGVQAVAGSTLYRPAMNVSTDLTSASSLWPMGGGRENAGGGIKVGIIDSGIDETHPFFSCKAEIPHKVYASGVAGYSPDMVLVNDHGTHVSGTVAGCVTELTEGPVTGTISGMAPGADLYDYNIFPGFGAGYVAFGGSALDHDIVAALEDTVMDGVDVINMSIGGGVRGPHDLVADAVNATVDAGIVVAVAGGNSGPGDGTVTSPGTAARAITAGASTNPHFIGIAVTVGATMYGAALGDFDSFGLVTADYTVTTPTNGCEPITNDVSGKIALIDRGGCTFTAKVRNAEAAGAAGVLVVNNSAGDPTAMGHDGTNPFPGIPAAMMGMAEGNAIKPGGTMTIDGTAATEIVSANADIMAAFSGRGPSQFTYLIKPDVTAPGTNIYSSVFEGGFEMFQGTSMATPHVTGAAALLRALHPDWSPADVKSALVNTASRTVTDHAAAAADPGPLARGGGRIDLAAATGTPLAFEPASASFGYWSGNKDATATIDLMVRNLTGSDQSCTVTVTGPSLVTASAAELALAGGESTSFALTMAAGQAADTAGGDYDGDVVVDCGGTTLRVPWWVRISRHGKP